MAARDVPVAILPGSPTMTSSGTITIPPPTPKSALKTPATRPIASSFNTASYRMAVVARPELASVPEETRSELRRLLDRYALLACVSGRTGEDAARVVDLEGPVYVGVHGLELAPEAEHWRGPLQEFAESVRWPIEDKGLAVVFHYREA